MNGKVFIVALFAIAVGAILYFNSRRASTGTDAPAAAKKPATEIIVLYSTEKKDWLEATTNAFQTAHPDIAVKLVGKGSLEAAAALLDGKEQPTLWSPADSLVLSLLTSDWQTKNGTPLIAAEGSPDAPQSLVITPLIFVIWEDRAQALLSAPGSKLTWKLIHDAVSSNRGWPAVGGKADWGFVKLGHTDPTRSNSGMQALLSMSFEYYKKNSGLSVGELLDPKYQEWVTAIEKGVTRFENSTGTFMTDMIRFGPSRYDLAVVYENLAASQLENAQGRWGNLKVYYPPTTLWSDHPIALLQGSWVTDAQKTAARAYLAHLRSRQAQEMALQFGFRPADPSVPVKTDDPHNPFNRLAAFGVQVDIPPAATPPGAPVVRNLITMWSRVAAERQ
jgi:ABC-type Fe3+ transport system substrate-binding protein